MNGSIGVCVCTSDVILTWSM